MLVMELLARGIQPEQWQGAPSCGSPVRSGTSERLFDADQSLLHRLLVPLFISSLQVRGSSCS